MADEGALFEGLRLGSSRAFTELLAEDGPTMRRLARLYVPAGHVDPLLHQTWAVALPGLDMFTWHTSLRAWLTGILVTYGRAAGPAVPPHPPATTGARPGPPSGPLPWATLRWSGLWPDDGWAVLEDGLAALPLPQREVLWLHDVEGWGWREVLDTLGLTAEQGAALRDGGRSALAGAVAAHLGAGPGDPAEEGDRHAGVAALLAALLPAGEPVPPPDPQLLRAFAGWRRRRGVRPWRRWWWELARRRQRHADGQAQASRSVPTVSPESSPVGTDPGRR